MSATSKYWTRTDRPHPAAGRPARVFGGGAVIAALVGLWLGLPQGDATRVGAQGQDVVEQLTATAANVRDAGSEVRIEILRWSTAEEGQALVDSLAPLPPAPPPDPEAEGRGGGGGFGGRGRGRGAPEEPPDPITRLTDAIAELPTVGYVWTSEIAGYSIKYAHRIPESDGERILLALRRRLGQYTGRWTPTGSGAETDYGFTWLELALDADGTGRGWASLTTEVVSDEAGGTLTLVDPEDSPPILEEIQRR